MNDAKALGSLARILRREPYRFITTRDSHEALEWVRRHSVNLLIADEHLPRTSGRDLLRAVRALSPDLTLLILTGYPGAGSIRERPSGRGHHHDLKRSIRELLHIGRGPDLE